MTTCPLTLTLSPRFIYQYCFSSAGRGNGRGAMPFLMSFALEHEIVTVAWIDNASVQFPLNIYATKGFTLSRREQISGVDARNAGPLSADKSAELAPFLAANQHVIIDDRIRNLAAEILGSEKNPVLAARKLYDWE